MNVDWPAHHVAATHYPNGNWDNYYRANKIAGEAFTKAFALKNDAIGVSLRLGWFPGEPSAREDLRRKILTKEQLLWWYEQALDTQASYSAWTC